MLRVETQELDGTLICRLEGRFTGDGAEQVRTLVTRCDNNLEPVVDLTDVMFIDTVGENVLSFIKKLGGEFVAETSYARHICERLQLPLVRKHKPNSEFAGKTNGRDHHPGDNSRRL
jgi:anti-anti-sigma regulatory factor